MAESIIPKNLVNDVENIKSKLSATSLVGTRSSNIADGTLSGIFDKATNTVRINLCWSNTTNVSPSTTLFSVPYTFRPSGMTTGAGIVIKSDNSITACNYAINANGQVMAYYAGSTNIRGGIAHFEYML